MDQCGNVPLRRAVSRRGHLPLHTDHTCDLSALAHPFVTHPFVPDPRLLPEESFKRRSQQCYVHQLEQRVNWLEEQISSDLLDKIKGMEKDINNKDLIINDLNAECVRRSVDQKEQAKEIDKFGKWEDKYNSLYFDNKKLRIKLKRTADCNGTILANNISLVKEIEEISHFYEETKIRFLRLEKQRNEWIGRSLQLKFILDEIKKIGALPEDHREWVEPMVEEIEKHNREGHSSFQNIPSHIRRKYLPSHVDSHMEFVEEEEEREIIRELSQEAAEFNHSISECVTNLDEARMQRTPRTPRTPLTDDVVNYNIPTLFS